MEFDIRSRQFYEDLEAKNLAPYATRSAGAHQTRLHPGAFRRLKHKQQVFLISDGDHYRTRITHTMEVSQLSRTLAKALGLNEELTEAIALGHDLGHTPFGHIGEVVLNEILSGKDDLNGLLDGKNRGGFKHNYQSIRVVDHLEKKYRFDGLNLTAPVREGILKHTRLFRDRFHYPDFDYQGLHFEHDMATTLEGQVVAVCDEIAQRTHDLEDGIRAGLVELEQVRQLELIRQVETSRKIRSLLKTDRYTYRNEMIRGLINALMDDIIGTALTNLQHFYQRKKRLHFFDEEIIRFGDRMNPRQQELDRFIYKEIIFTDRGNEVNRHNKKIIRSLVRGYLENPARLPDYLSSRLNEPKPAHGKNPDQSYRLDAGHVLRMVADHVASMTDRFAMLEFEKYQTNDSR